VWTGLLSWRRFPDTGAFVREWNHGEAEASPPWCLAKLAVEAAVDPATAIWHNS